MNQEEPSSVIRNLLKDSGLRYSRPRASILTFFREADYHISAEDLYLTLKRRGENLSLSTVYLNLATLTEAGLIRQFNGVAGEALYDSNVAPHYHLICKETGEVMDVPLPMIDGVPLTRYLKERFEKLTGWEIEEPTLELRGVSPKAAKE
jgi:Fe2+ or Zn2+ uptake regulation protein